MKPENIRIKTVAPGEIKVPRGPAPKNVPALAAAIRELGFLLNPPAVTPDLRLIAGRRRLAAVKSLGWEKIPVHVLELDEVAAEMAEIDENLQRQELSTLERAEQTHRRKQLYEALNPEAKAGKAQAAAANRAQGRKDVAGKKPATSFAADAAKKSGVDESTVRREVRIAQNIDHRARDLIRNTPTADNQRDLLALARAQPEIQVEAARQLKEGKAKNAIQAIRSIERKKDLKHRSEIAGGVIAERPAGELPWELIQGDCVEVLRTMKAGQYRLAFADPQYNIGRDYHGKGAAADRLPDQEYLAHVEAWALECRRVLTDDGSLWVIVSDDYADDIGVILRRKAGLHRRAWIKWFETFGVSRARNFGRCSRHIFHMVKDPKRFVFHESAVLGPSARLHIYGDKRADPDGKILDDVWGVPWIGDSPGNVVAYDPLPRLNGNNAERIPGFDNQLPRSLVQRIVELASDPGDRVLDPFNGTATTGVAAITTGRLYTGIDIAEQAIAVAQDRLKTEYANVSHESKKRRTA